MKRRFDGERVELIGNPLAYLMNWFDDLMLPGGYGFGPFPLEYVEIEAYGRVMKLGLRVWEIETLRDMSEAYCVAYARREKIKSEMPAGMKSIPLNDHKAIKAMFSKQGGTKKGKK